MKVNNPLKPRFPIRCNNQSQLDNAYNRLNKLGFEWLHKSLYERWRNDFDGKDFPIELRLYHINDDKITIHKISYES